MKSPSAVADQFETIANAWKDLAPTKNFGGLTLDQYKTVVQPSLDARDGIKTARVQHTDALMRRFNSDNAANNATLLVVNAIKGDPTEGEDSALYEACGYVPKSKRKSGLSRKAKAAVAQVKPS